MLCEGVNPRQHCIPALNRKINIAAFVPTCIHYSAVYCFVFTRLEISASFCNRRHLFTEKGFNNCGMEKLAVN